MIDDADQMPRMGAASRAMAEARFDVHAVTWTIMDALNLSAVERHSS
jgi:hypothetical protein